MGHVGTGWTSALRLVIERSRVRIHPRAQKLRSEASILRPGRGAVSPSVIPSVEWQSSVASGLGVGTTEYTAVCTQLVTGLRDRGLDAERGVLVVFDGGNVLAAAVRGVFSTNARIQRCRRTRNDNVLDHLPEAERPLVQRRLRIKGYQELPALAAALERAAANEALLDLVLTA